MPKRIIVLGTMRSGTSLVAELIRLWGAYAGLQSNLWKSDINDPRGYGYMEYIPLQDLNDELLDHNDRTPPSIEAMAARASEPEFKEKAQGLIRDMDQQAGKNQARAWVWKDARLPFTLPFWVNFWENAVYVVTIRHPAEIALSSAKTEDFNSDNLPYSAAFLYWQYCMLNIISFTQNNPSKIFVEYDQLIEHPNEECARLCRFLDEHTGQEPASASQRIAAMTPQIAKNERHHHYEKSLAEMGQAAREQRALYNFLRVKTIYPDEPFVKDDFALYPGWKEYLQSLDMLITLSHTEGS